MGWVGGGTVVRMHSLIIDVAGVGELLHVGAGFNHLPASLDVHNGSIYHVLQSQEEETNSVKNRKSGTV